VKVREKSQHIINKVSGCSVSYLSLDVNVGTSGLPGMDS
jgi:hypothetical protein